MPRPPEIIDEEDIKTYEDDQEIAIRVEGEDDESEAHERANEDEDKDEDEVDDEDEDGDEAEGGDESQATSDKTNADVHAKLNETTRLLSQARLEQRVLANERARDRVIALKEKHGQLINTASFYAQQHAKAISEANGPQALEAQSRAEEARLQANEIANVHDELLARIQEDDQELELMKNESARPATRGLTNDPELNRQIEKLRDQFAQEINFHNLDQKLQNAVIRMDKKVLRDGWNPASPKYWAVLRRRFENKYHNRMEQKSQNYRSESMANNNDETESGGPAVSGRSNTHHKPEKEYLISRERKEALIAAGVWDDPVLRRRYVKRYQQWDQENKGRA